MCWKEGEEGSAYLHHASLLGMKRGRLPYRCCICRRAPRRQVCLTFSYPLPAFVYLPLVRDFSATSIPAVSRVHASPGGAAACASVCRHKPYYNSTAAVPYARLVCLLLPPRPARERLSHRLTREGVACAAAWQGHGAPLACCRKNRRHAQPASASPANALPIN